MQAPGRAHLRASGDGYGGGHGDYRGRGGHGGQRVGDDIRRVFR